MTRPPEPERARLPGCACGARLWRHVLDHEVHSDGTDVRACMACGHVRADYVYWDAGVRESAVAGYADRPLPGDVLAWLGAWPRVVPGGPCWVPANVRCPTEDALLALDDHAREAQAQGSPVRRVHAAGYPADPPPEELPEDLAVFAFAWWAMTAPDAEVALRIRARTYPGERRGYPTLLAYEKVRRQEWAEDLATRIESGGAARRAALREIAGATRWETTYDSRPVVVAGPPPSLRPLVESLPRDGEVAAALVSFDRWGD